MLHDPPLLETEEVIERSVDPVQCPFTNRENEVSIREETMVPVILTLTERDTEGPEAVTDAWIVLSVERGVDVVLDRLDLAVDQHFVHKGPHGLSIR